MLPRPEFRARYGPWALVVGASEGIGAAFAHELGARGLHVVLVALDTPALVATAEDVRVVHGVETRAVALDVAAPNFEEALIGSVTGLDVGLLVYSAAFAPIGSFLAQPLALSLRALDVNCRGPLVCAHAFGKAMAARGRGGIVLLSSLAGFHGTASIATYAATKAFNLVFAESLWAELSANGIDVLAVCPGATRTPGYLSSNPRGTAPLMEPTAVAREALASLASGPTTVIGVLNRAAAFFLGRVSTRRAAVTFMSRATRRLYEGA